jgi:hypothetical protein
MTRYMCIWKAVSSGLPEDKEVLTKRAIEITQDGQEAMKTGRLKEWGISPDGRKGYVVLEGSETDLARLAWMGTPGFEWEIYPALTVDQWMGVLKTPAIPIQK